MPTAFLVERNKGNRELVFAWMYRENIYAVLLRRPICESEFSEQYTFQQFSLTGELCYVIHWYQCRTDETHMCNVRMNILTNICKLEYSNLTNKRIVLCVRYDTIQQNTMYLHTFWMNQFRGIVHFIRWNLTEIHPQNGYRSDENMRLRYVIEWRLIYIIHS